MSQTTPLLQPSLIVVTGRPGSGKTSLAHALAQAIRCPAICRDEIKEGFVNTAEANIAAAKRADDDIAWRVYETFFDTIELLLTQRVTLVAEAAFQHKLWAPKLEHLQQLAQLKIVVCTIDPNLARARRIARGQADPARNHFHPDPAVDNSDEPAVPIEPYDPPHLNVPTLIVDTTAGYQPAIETIVSFARS